MQNEATAAYYLLFDNRRCVLNSYLGAEVQGIVKCDFHHVLQTDHCHPRYLDYQRMFITSQFPVNRKWSLGLQSRGNPHEIMMVVLKALQELAVNWKKIGHYNVKCRWIPGTSGHRERLVNVPLQNNYIGEHGPAITQNDGVINSPNVVKFEMQLFKTVEQKYLLDLQRVQGAQFLFLEFCAAFLVQLGVL